MMKKNLAVLFVLVVCSLFIFACGKTDTDDSKKAKATETVENVKATENAEDLKATADAGDKKEIADNDETETAETVKDAEIEKGSETADNDVKSTETAKDTENAENTGEKNYWLCGTGIEDGPDYVGGVCKIYLKQNTIVLEGNLLKSASQEDYAEQIGTVVTYAGEEIEVSADCKVIQDEGNEEKAYAYSEYIELMELSETDNAAGIYTAITIKNGKVVEMYYSS